jgi:hypothetical protein
VYHFRDPGAGFDVSDLNHATQSPSPEDVVAAALHRADMGARRDAPGVM